MDNIDIIKPQLFFSVGEFYMIQIIKRGKDNFKETGSNKHYVIKDYYIYSIEDLDKKYHEIKSLCDFFGARAYIRLSPRNVKDIAKDMLIELGDAFRNESYVHLKKIYSTVVGRNKGTLRRRIVDIDGYKSGLTFASLSKMLFNLKPVGEKIYCKVPTPNGVHFITKPFDLKRFKEIYPDIDVHKNNPTLLYCYSIKGNLQ